MLRSVLLLSVCFEVAACGFEGSEGDDPSDLGGGGGGDSGSAGADRDQDGVLDAVDNCVTVANPEQYDEDGDLRGDVCDNCPHVSNADQLDVGETQEGELKDGIGDACDPNPDRGGDRLVLFLGFNNASDLAGWQVAGVQDFTVAGGQLQNRAKTDLALAWRSDLKLRDATLVTKVSYVSLSTTYPYRGVALMGRFGRGGAAGTLGTGVGCGELQDINSGNGVPFLDGANYNGGSFSNQPAGQTTLTESSIAVYRTKLGGGGAECTVGGQRWNRGSSSSYAGVAFSVWGAAVNIDYLVAYQR